MKDMIIGVDLAKRIFRARCPQCGGSELAWTDDASQTTASGAVVFSLVDDKHTSLGGHDGPPRLGSKCDMPAALGMSRCKAKTMRVG